MSTLIIINMMMLFLDLGIVSALISMIKTFFFSLSHRDIILEMSLKSTEVDSGYRVYGNYE